ncbi:hypothetical protein [Mycoplasmopsis cricetuli]|uniref:hypothetical protein n=1 Tax=Mycoplasmopsis cricetuli TaxID=171283 RepID=UPI000471E8A3|nr:hypothetical protein [Mycoplasmopsis cricetuli]
MLKKNKYKANIRKKDLVKFLKLRLIEELPMHWQNNFKKINIWFLIAILVVAAFIFMTTILVMTLKVKWLTLLYKFFINIPLGNLAFVIPFFLLAWFGLLLSEKWLHNKAITWFVKTQKINFTTFKIAIQKFLALFFIAFALFDHIIVYFVNQTYQNFEFQYHNGKYLFLNGFWKNSALMSSDEISFNHIGFILEFCFNMIYYIGFSSVVPVIFLILLLVFIFLELYFLSFLKKPITKLRKFSINEYIQKITNKNTILIDTVDSLFYLDFLFSAARFYKISYQHLFFSELEKEIFYRIKNKNEIKKIIKLITYKENLNSLNTNEVKIDNNLLKLNNTNNLNVKYSKNENMFKTTEFDLNLVYQNNKIKKNNSQLDDISEANAKVNDQQMWDEISPIWSDK